MIRWVTHNCQVGACSACNWPFAACAHECHVDGLAGAAEVESESELVPEPMVHSPNPAFEAMVSRRATALCLAAPDASHSMASAAPCAIHEAGARQALFGAWLGQQNAVA